MKRKEIERKKSELIKILKEEDAATMLEKLQVLAKEVGASVTRMEKTLSKHDTQGRQHYSFFNEITESEIVQNIQIALQTATFIDMCKTSAKHFWITLAVSLIALLSMIAAWVAALAKT